MIGDAKDQLSRAAYHYGECDTDLDHIREGYKRAGSLVSKMAEILIKMEAIRVSTGNVYLDILPVRLQEIDANLKAAFELSWKITREKGGPSYDILRDSISRAQGHARKLDEATVDMWEIRQMDVVTNYAEEVAASETTFKNAAEQIEQVQRHFTDVRNDCQEYKEIL